MTMTETPMAAFDPFGLSPRERDVLRLVSQGLTNREIAAELDISWGMVRQHMIRVRVKLGARNTTHAVVIALRAGVIRLDEQP
jgi:two-component system NarL family response regulator